MPLMPLPVLIAVVAGSALAGVLLFAFAERLPSLFPPAFTRLVGFASVCTGLVLLWTIYEDWLPLVLLGVPSLGAMGIAHLLQTRPPVEVTLPDAERQLSEDDPEI